MSTVAGFAPAKINLTLKVNSRGEDGFHQIDSVVAFLDLCDSLVFEVDQGTQQLSLTGLSDHIPTDKHNLVFKAARALAEYTGTDLPFRAALHKRIPPGSGLGGGSSDAATTLMCLEELHGLDLSTQQLCQVGESVGADVPMFVVRSGGACRIRGRGQNVTPLDFSPRGYCVLLLPDLHVSTAKVYAAWDEQPTQSSSTCQALVGCNRDPEAWLGSCFNDLYAPASRLYPALEQLKEQAVRILGRPVGMTGSGSALFTAYSDQNKANAAGDVISSAMNIRTVVTAFRSGAPIHCAEVYHADHGDARQACAD